MARHSRTPDAVIRTSKRARVLIIDDEQDITNLLASALRGKDIEVTVYNDSEAALKEFKASQYDLALVDIRMPGINGLELVKSLKSIDRKIITCFLSAFEIHRIDFLKNGLDPDSFNCHIKKPVLLTDFVEKVTRILEGV
jgi:DNA-binding response OmpR family regulator